MVPPPITAKPLPRTIGAKVRSLYLRGFNTFSHQEQCAVADQTQPGFTMGSLRRISIVGGPGIKPRRLCFPPQSPMGKLQLVGQLSRHFVTALHDAGTYRILRLSRAIPAMEKAHSELAITPSIKPRQPAWIAAARPPEVEPTSIGKQSAVMTETGRGLCVKTASALISPDFSCPSICTIWLECCCRR